MARPAGRRHLPSTELAGTAVEGVNVGAQLGLCGQCGDVRWSLAVGTRRIRHLPRLAAVRLERLVSRVDLYDLRLRAHGIVDDVAAIKAAQPLPITPATANGTR